MKKAFSVALLILLLGFGVLLVYKEAHAYPYACLMAQSYCWANCQGEFTLDDCWYYQGQIYCWFTCKNMIWHCQWNFPQDWGECDGPL